ncbi:DoxX family protein [Marinoscillum sp. MHG1-6]|uniref:DoxX family protein n=1 Tax=Marinoscillum sp. MHG1-6 TaxID=2959627 RepID=UPI002157ED71|nr:DoxX family protein [Marinoscillum sp. MHG1-6]
MKIFEWLLSILAAVIMLQTLYFKFTAQPESVYIFNTVGMEPWGRIGSGVVELIAGILLLIPTYRIYGAILSLGVISGAIFFHLTRLGVEVQGDGGSLFYLAVAVFVASAIITFIKRKEIPIIGEWFK